jgi:cytochrome c biogenesis protein CcdA/thiol-disulfide isomerase/thioredoxin
MLLLIIFGFLAGAATAITPCVLPVLPIALSAGATGGRRRPLGIVAGLTVSFVFAIVALVYVIDALGLSGELIRNVAIVFLIVFGAILVIRPLADRLEARISSVTSRFAPKTGGGGDGFWSGTAVGASLGILYLPCAGPILAGVIVTTASQDFSAGRLAVAFSYGLGSALVLYVLMLGGRRLVRPLAKRGALLQVATGAIMVLVALAMLGEYDLKFQRNVTANLPSFLVNPAEGLENTSTAQTALNKIKGINPHGIGALAIAGEGEESPPVEERKKEGGVRPGEGGAGTETAGSTENAVQLYEYGPAPEFTDTEDWFNTPGDRPLTMKELRGKVVLIDFWTYSCINCIRTLPYLEAWDKRYRKDGLVIVGVHSPEFPFEREASNVKMAIEEEGIEYPVVQDNELGTWNEYGNQYWPAEYFVDAKGNVRYAHFGEGEYGEKETVIRELLREAGRAPGKGRTHTKGLRAERTVTTPETYLGPYRAAGIADGMEPALAPGLSDFKPAPTVPPNEWTLGGHWQVGLKHIEAREDASLQLNFGARRAYLVLGSKKGPKKMRVFLDGKPITAADSGSDVHDGVVTVDEQRLYNLVELPRVEQHLLELRPEAGIMGYAFTFG